MRKRLLHLFSALCLAGLAANAEVIQNYEYNFDDEINTSDSYFHPTGWIHSVSSSYGLGTYAWSADSGIEGSGALLGTQKASYYNDLLITPAITGNAFMYVKQKEETGTISFFSVGNKTGEHTYSSTKLDWTVPELSTEEWVKVEIPAQENARIGLRLDKVYIDDFFAEECDVQLAKGFTISNVKVDDKTANANENDIYTLTYTADITNTGEAVLTPGERDIH